ncbi:coagulase domain-containing protein [Staphylococcus chromogenes]|uniref:coagulase domain-containing protein n=1 Tax=Staphylococcus chromogenes TaxID=46126 RepID=UPI002887F9D3|nr:coagulase domain-containing protein [Staphylococcus chromogenes]MDT0747890.1 coagulase domain-containing protein [Staphylococcus chromogenes]
MKKKLLVLSVSAILASNFIFDNNASAVVSENEYKSSALSVEGKINPAISLERYQDNLESLINSLSVEDFSGYDQPEYKKAYEKYQKRFLAELDALNKFISEDTREAKNIRKYDSDKVEKKLGLTQERYEKVYQNLKQNREDFDDDVKSVENKNQELKRFNESDQENANKEIVDLENKVLMVAKAFPGQHEARANLYNKLDMIMAYEEVKPKEIISKNIPRNNRMLVDLKEDLETIIDEFFAEIDLARPSNIPMLTEDNEHDVSIRKKLREDAENAKNNPNLVDPGVQQRADRTAERLAKMTKASKEAKENAAKAKATVKALQAQKAPTTKKFYTKNPDAFPHKQLKQHHDSKNELVIKEPTQQLPTYTVMTERQTQPVLKQKHREETFTLPMAPRQSQPPELKGMSGESNHVTTDADSKPSNQYGGNGNLIEFTEDTTPKAKGANNQKQTTTEDTTPEVKETITESNVVDIDQSSFYQKSGYKYGYSESDTSGYTDRDKRAIKRNLVREAEEKVNQYVNSHSAQDLVAAREKVKTLDPAQQNRLNKQIDKIYNGQY